ncbi:unnamed protein product [Ilex paraguariensis]|uniref:Uncharacterized protein n=1 Tax=Ilex paraguariensis TaxID=185542 RepID=A0ABC8RR98_9AQUA
MRLSTAVLKLRGRDGKVEALDSTSTSAQKLGDASELLGSTNTLGSAMTMMGNNNLGSGDAGLVSKGFGSISPAMKTSESTQADGTGRQEGQHLASIEVAQIKGATPCKRRGGTNRRRQFWLVLAGTGAGLGDARVGLGDVREA